MGTLAEFRAQYPMYDSIPDRELADKMYAKFYTHMDRAEYDKKLGLAPEAKPAPSGPPLSDDPQEWEDYYRHQREKATARTDVLPENKEARKAEKEGSFLGGLSIVNMVKDAVGAGERAKLGPDNVSTGDVVELGTLGSGAPGKMLTQEAKAGLKLSDEYGSHVIHPGAKAGPGPKSPTDFDLPPAHREAIEREYGPPASQGVRPQITRDEVVAAGERQGVNVPRFIATDSLIPKRVAGGLQDIPVVGDMIKNANTKMAEDVGERVSAQASRFSPNANEQTAGATSRDAMSRWITGQSKRIVSREYDELDRFIRPDHKVPLSRTRVAAGHIVAKDIESATTDGQKVIELIREAINRPDGLTYDGLKHLRTTIGERLSGDLVEHGISHKTLDRLYAALSEDLRHGAGRAGIVKKGSNQQKAIDAFDNATRTAREVAGQREELASIIGAKGDVSPGLVFDRLTAMASAGSRGDIYKLQLARRAMGEDAWREVGAAAINRMGMDKNGQFSPARFTSDYGSKRMSEAGKEALFGRETKAALDDLTTLSAAWEQHQKFGNPSGSGRAITVMSAIGAAAASPWSWMVDAGAAAGIGGGLSYVLSRPANAQATSRWARAMTQYLNDPTPGKKTLVAQAQARLVDALNDDGEKKPDVIPQGAP
jgi:hypothetical protein